MKTQLAALLLPGLMAAASVAAQAPVPVAQSSVGGLVVDAMSGKAIPYVRVVTGSRDAKTDEKGRFLLEGVPSGRITLTLTRDGYVQLRSLYALTAGQKLENVVARMSRSGIVSGRLLDARGNPVVRGTVHARYYRTAADGRRELKIEDYGYTDDRGVFRLINLAPDDYFVTFSPSPDFSFDLSAPKQIPSFFYPGVMDTSRAVMIHVNSGEETRLFDIMAPPNGFGATSFRLMNPAQSEAKDVSINFSYYTWESRTTGESSGGGDINNKGKRVEPANELERVAPDELGMLIAGVQWTSPGGSKGLLVVRVDSNGSPADIPVTLVEPDGQLRIRAILEGENSEVSPLKGVQVDMRKPLLGLSGSTRFAVTSVSEPGPTPMSELRGGKKPLPETGADGESLLTEMTQGRFDIVNVLQLPAGHYVASAEQGGRNALIEGPVVTNRVAPESVLTLRIRPGTAVIRGKLADRRGALHDGFIAALPDGPLQDSKLGTLVRTARTDQTGAFELLDVTPGAYRIYAWSADEYPTYYSDYVFLNRDFRERFAGRSLQLAVPESGVLSLPLNLPEEP